MRCDETKERLLEFIYTGDGTIQPDSETREHLRTCSLCRNELEELKQTREFLQLWRDEPPLRRVSIPEQDISAQKSSGWKYMRYAAIAALLLVTFMALANTQITWNKEGFSFSTRLLPWRQTEKDYYTKAELRNLLKQAFDDSEYRMTETNYLMMQKMLDVVEHDRWMDLHLARGQNTKNQNTN